jgi:hypothetical protein
MVAVYGPAALVPSGPIVTAAVCAAKRAVADSVPAPGMIAGSPGVVAALPGGHATECVIVAVQVPDSRPRLPVTRTLPSWPLIDVVPSPTLPGLAEAGTLIWNVVVAGEPAPGRR